MIFPGLTTATTRHLSVEETVNLASENGLTGIEWEANHHVVPGELENAKRAKRLCTQAGLSIPSYGSYYKAGVSESAGLRFPTVLETAKTLEAPCIRIWAGEQDYDKADPAYIDAVVRDTLRIADLSEKVGIRLIFEFHRNSLTNSTKHTLKFAKQVDHPAVTFSWQPIHLKSQESCERSITQLLPRLNTIHVFHWDAGSYLENGYTKERFIEEKKPWTRHPLEIGAERWKSYISIANSSGRDHWALLEFTKDDSTHQLSQDAKTLKSIISASK